MDALQSSGLPTSKVETVDNDVRDNSFVVGMELEGLLGSNIKALQDEDKQRISALQQQETENKLLSSTRRERIRAWLHSYPVVSTMLAIVLFDILFWFGVLLSKLTLDTFLFVVGSIIVVVFLVEILLRLLWKGTEFFHHWWNVFDLVLTITMFMFMFLWSIHDYFSVAVIACRMMSTVRLFFEVRSRQKGLVELLEEAGEDKMKHLEVILLNERIHFLSKIQQLSASLDSAIEKTLEKTLHKLTQSVFASAEAKAPTAAHTAGKVVKSMLDASMQEGIFANQHHPPTFSPPTTPASALSPSSPLANNLRKMAIDVFKKEAQKEIESRFSSPASSTSFSFPSSSPSSPVASIAQRLLSPVFESLYGSPSHLPASRKNIDSLDHLQRKKDERRDREASNNRWSDLSLSCRHRAFALLQLLERRDIRLLAVQACQRFSCDLLSISSSAPSSAASTSLASSAANGQDDVIFFVRGDNSQEDESELLFHAAASRSVRLILANVHRSLVASCLQPTTTGASTNRGDKNDNATVGDLDVSFMLVQIAQLLRCQCQQMHQLSAQRKEILFSLLLAHSSRLRPLLPEDTSSVAPENNARVNPHAAGLSVVTEDDGGSQQQSQEDKACATTSFTQYLLHCLEDDDLTASTTPASSCSCSASSSSSAAVSSSLSRTQHKHPSCDENSNEKQPFPVDVHSLLLHAANVLGVGAATSASSTGDGGVSAGCNQQLVQVLQAILILLNGGSSPPSLVQALSALSAALPAATATTATTATTANVAPPALSLPSTLAGSNSGKIDALMTLIGKLAEQQQRTQEQLALLADARISNKKE